MRLRYGVRSHPGLLRTSNEDSVYAGPRLLAVADGMGGHAAGEVASAVAIATIAPLDADVPGSDLTAALRESARTANAHLRDMVAGDPELAGMGTTLDALLFNGNRLGLLHIGDSRVYLLRDDELTQVTHDHTFVQSLIDSGRISEEEASTHPQRSVITKVLDGHDDHPRGERRDPRPRARLHPRARRRLREHPPRPPGPGRGRRLARRGPRLHQRHLPRPREGRPPDPRPAGHAHPHRQDLAGAARMRFRYGVRSHPGLLRSSNEDSVYAGPRLLAVADGMGGHAAGEVASAVAIATVAPLDHDVPGAGPTRCSCRRSACSAGSACS
jgi:serine/threonine protein phosphatase PrpC